MAGQARSNPTKTKLLEELPRPLARLGFGNAANLQPGGGVVERGTPGQQQVALRHITDVAEARRVDIAMQRDLAAGWLLQPGDQREQRRLATAAWPDQCDELASVDM